MYGLDGLGADRSLHGVWANSLAASSSGHTLTGGSWANDLPPTRWGDRLAPMHVDPTFLRESRGEMSRPDLARRAGVAPQTIKRLENDPDANTTYETI